MPNSNGNNENALVVFPFEDMGMEGGSQISIPFNPLVPFNALNAQVIRKVPKKPVIVDSTTVRVEYSAAANPVDPAGAGSINSTSQNYFSTGKIGANFDPVATAANVSSTGETAYKDEQAYNIADIAKTEFWDKIHQPNAAKLATPVLEKGLSQADTQNSYVPAKPLVLPDQGLRGYVDKAAGVRSMPGISDPYKANVPQSFEYSAAQQSFVAQNIPATSIDDKGRVNPYPLMRVVAKEGDVVKSAIDAVYTTASETGCSHCHIKGEKGSDDTVWRTPVTMTELLTADGKPGPATGKGAFPFKDNIEPTITLTGDPLVDFEKYGYGPALHNPFDNKQLNSLVKWLTRNNPTPATGDTVAKGLTLNYDANGIRTDRVAQSRWLKPDGTTSETNPGNDKTWKLQIRLKFKGATDYGEDNFINREKAARWNTMLLHDYMTPVNYNNARDDIFAEIADDAFTTRNTVTMCASHHTSTLKQDTGAAAVSQVKTLSDWTRTTHAFHGKMQVYNRDVSAAESKDGLAHSKGDLLRDERGHPIMLGGRGWDSIDNDANRLPMTLDSTTKKYTIPAAVFAPAARNNWDKNASFDPLGAEMLPVGEDIPMEQNCLTCHTGKTEHSYRDIHYAAGMKCDSCHGGMLAVGLTYPNEKYDGNLTMAGALGVDDPNTLTAPDFRRAWIDEPDCGSCHVGDANLDKDGEIGLKHFYSAGALKQGWLDDDKAAASIHPVNARFAVMPNKELRPEKLAATDADVAAGLATKKGNTIYVNREVSQALYRKSGDVHGSGSQGVLNCSTCHGGSHGIWPNKDPAANDNVTAKQLQGYDGNIAECSTCHIKDDFKTGLVATDGGPATAEFPNGVGVGQGVRAGTVVNPAGLDAMGSPSTIRKAAYLAGPHGMHPVADQYWYHHADGAAASAKPVKIKGIEMNGGWHNDMAKMPGPDGEDQCAACHGADHKGTRLSRTLINRVFTNAKGKPFKVAKDKIIGCDLCHTLAKSFTGAPNPKSPTGGWPAAKQHMPPMPEAVTSTPSSGGGSGGHG
ncbi:MAG: PKD domain-containing protein [Methylococcales bacterium]